MISVNLPENSQDSSQSALELLKPDPPLEQKAEAKIQDVGEEDELEALRMAAIASMRPKKSSYKVQAHPVRSNLLSIVPVEDQPESKKPKLFSAVILPNKRNSESPGKNTTSKFNRHNDENNESSDLSSSEEEIEVEEEVTATESESEEQSTTKKGEEESSKTAATEAPSGVVKKQISIEPDDVLKIDCTDEVDEFTNFLNEFEDDLKSPAVTAEGQTKAAAKNTANNKGGPKPKKTKIILVKKKVKKNRNQGSKAAPEARSRSQRSRSPNMRRRSRSPRRRRTPPRGGRYSPYRRSPSPYRRRRYSRSPSPRGRYRPRSRSPRSYRSPPRRPMRRSRSPTSPNRRGGSAPRHMIRSRSGSREKSPTNKKEGDPKQDKSKSLPPSRVDSQNGGKKNSSNKQSAEEKAAFEAEEKLKKLPTPEREKLLQRRKKFEGNMPLKSFAGKKISLKRAAETNIAFDNNGSVDDTNEDMFEHDAIEDHQPLPAKNRRQGSKAPTEPLTKVVTDLRVQLHKKRQQQQQITKVVEPEIVFEEELPEFESDVDSLENARVTSSDEEEIVQTTISRKKIITSSGNSSSNRLVTKSGIKGSPRRVGFNQELPTKRTFGQRSVMSRLGAKVSDDSEEENSKKRGKIVISDSGEEDQDDCLTPPETETAISLSKKEKKAEKERKKAEKKKKKEKKKEKKKSKKQRSSSSEPEMPAANQSAGKGNAVAVAAENSEDDELMNFFENLDSEDILLEKMKKKNDVLNARHKKIEADKKLHS